MKSNTVYDTPLIFGKAEGIIRATNFFVFVLYKFVLW